MLVINPLMLTAAKVDLHYNAILQEMSGKCDLEMLIRTLTNNSPSDIL